MMAVGTQSVVSLLFGGTGRRNNLVRTSEPQSGEIKTDKESAKDQR